MLQCVLWVLCDQVCLLTVQDLHVNIMQQGNFKPLKLCVSILYLCTVCYPAHMGMLHEFQVVWKLMW